MTFHDLVVKGGRLVTAADTFDCDIAVTNGKIAALGSDLKGKDVIDATGRFVMPGGIDSHVHISQPSGPDIIMADDFASATLSAAYGGNTTIMPFCLQEQGMSMRQALKNYHALADGNCYIDVSFHMIISDPTDQLLGQDLPALVEDGYTSFKIFMTYDDLKLNDREILDVMSAARQTGALVMVHAENYDAIRFMTDQLEKAGKTAPLHHATSRPIVVEREATHRAISFAELVDVPLMVVHVSNGEAMEEIHRAQSKGLKIFAETCPQYLVLTEKDLDGLNMEGAKYVCSPPPRDAASQVACWNGIRRGIVSVFSSDHCPFRYDDPAGKLLPKGKTSFRWVPNGIPGVETRLPILFSEGVGKGHIDINTFVALTSTNHAKTYGLYPRKGTLMIGADADIAIWNPNKEITISQELLHHGADYTPYEDLKVTGWPETTIVRGKCIVRDGELCAQPGDGIYLERDRSPFAASHTV